MNTIYRKEPVNEEVSEEVNGVIVTDTVTRTKVIIYYIMGGTIVEKNDKFPFSELSNNSFPMGSTTTKPLWDTFIKRLIIPQRVANLIESAINNIAMHNAIPTYLVSSESGLDIDEFAKLSQAPPWYNLGCWRICWWCC